MAVSPSLFVIRHRGRLFSDARWSEGFGVERSGGRFVPSDRGRRSGLRHRGTAGHVEVGRRLARPVRRSVRGSRVDASRVQHRRAHHRAVPSACVFACSGAFARRQSCSSGGNARPQKLPTRPAPVFVSASDSSVIGLTRKRKILEGGERLGRHYIEELVDRSLSLQDAGTFARHSSNIPAFVR